MTGRLFITWLCLLALVAGTAWAGAEGSDWRVTAFPLNSPVQGGSWYVAAPSLLTRGLSLQGGYLALYAAGVWPGEAYTLEMTVPADARRAHVYLFDRWPQLPDARRIALPAGPVVIVPGRKTITYRWRIGIAPHSTGSVLYLMVRYPLRPGKGERQGPLLTLYAPAIAARNRTGHGITYLNGPQALLLPGGAPPLVGILPGNGENFGNVDHPAQPGGADWLKNDAFRQGLVDWQPAGGSSGVRREKEGLELLSRGPGEKRLTQRLDRRVRATDELVVSGDLRLGRPNDKKETDMVLTLCYRGSKGSGICGHSAELARFSTIASPVGENPVRVVPTGQWVHFRLALRQLPHQPTHLQSLTLHASGAGPVWIRDIHLRKGGSYE